MMSPIPSRDSIQAFQSVPKPNYCIMEGAHRLLLKLEVPYIGSAVKEKGDEKGEAGEGL